MMLTTLNQQYNLQRNGYHYTGKLDGVRGAGTINAIKSYQKAEKIAVDGVWGSITNSHSLTDAKSLQRKLNAHGANIKVDGILGTASEKAIKNFQKKNGLTADGVAGPATIKALNKGSKTTTWKDIKYFKRSEFACDCGGRYCNGFPVEMDMDVVEILDDIRSDYKEPITVTSGVRCKRRNKEVGGIDNSEHPRGKAVDFYVNRQNDTATGRNAVVKKAYAKGAKYSYANTPGMGNAVHINV